MCFTEESAVSDCIIASVITSFCTHSTATTPPPTTPPPPPPPKYCIKNRPIDIFGEWKTQCKCDGNYKRRQCKLNYSGELECWCSSKDGYRTSVAKIVDCHSNLDPL